MAKRVTNAELRKELELQRMTLKNLYDRLEKVEEALKPKPCDAQKAGVSPETEIEYFKRRIAELEEYIHQQKYNQRPIHPQTPVVPFTPEPYPGYPIYPPNPQWNPHWQNGPTCQVPHGFNCAQNR